MHAGKVVQKYYSVCGRSDVELVITQYIINVLLT